MEQVNSRTKTLGELTLQYLFVHKCWQDHKLAIKEGMSVERAIKDLREVKEQTRKYKWGLRLHFKASNLLCDIVCAPMDIDSDSKVAH